MTVALCPPLRGAAFEQQLLVDARERVLHHRRLDALAALQVREVIAEARHVDAQQLQLGRTLTTGQNKSVEPLQRYQTLRKRVLALDEYHLYDGMVPLLDDDTAYEWETTKELVTESVAPLGAGYQQKMRDAFAGGWLDVPRFAREGAFIVNCAVSPLVSLRHWPYERNSGLGGSGAWA